MNGGAMGCQFVEEPDRKIDLAGVLSTEHKDCQPNISDQSVGINAGPGPNQTP